MAKVTFATDVCKGCGLCVSACPKHLLVLAKDKINKKGYFAAEVADPEGCIACGTCARVCPDVCISVYKDVE